MAFTGNTWNQLKNLTAGDLANALKRDGFSEDTKGGSQHIYYRPPVPAQAIPARRVSVHVHPHKTYGAKMLQGLLADAGWNEDDLRRLKLIK
jgi:predicted RNA binding protein YcfA (HicA-like mRNA interferase family)